MTKQFQGKVALVTGGSSGLGQAAAVAFAREGAKVVLTYASSEDGAKETVRQIKDVGGEAIYVRADCKRAEDTEAMVAAAVKTFGRLDYAYNNGYQAKVAPLGDLSEEEWDLTIDGTLKSVWLSMKYEIKQMQKNGGGAIVNCTSDSFQVVFRGLGAYGAAKAGVVQLSRHAAAEYAPSIRINCACPGSFETNAIKTGAPMIAKLPQKWQQWMHDSFANQPMPRVAAPEEFSPAVIWLCSDAASYVTGAHLVVDGGMLLR